MKRLIVFAVIVLAFAAAPCWAQQLEVIQPQQPPPLEPYQHNVYGPGIHSDSTGRPFTYQPMPQFQTAPQPPVMGPVQQNGYGHGVHMDQYGRPVQAVPR